MHPVRSGTLTDITTHWFISPGRKVDTNPLFPLEHVKAVVLGRSDPEDERVNALAETPSRAEMAQIDAPGDTLNMRRWPSFNPNIDGTIPHHAVVPVLRAGTFGGRKWLCVQYGGQEGWIVAGYTNANF